jgi:hypothetical protein
VIDYTREDCTRTSQCYDFIPDNVGDRPLSDLRRALTRREFIDAGRVTPVIDRTYLLSETPQAIDHVGGGHARGKVVITMSDTP